MAGIKISDLPAATTPLAGTESIPIVQSSCTKGATISDIADIVSGDFVTNTEYASTSSVYTTVQSSSAAWEGVYSSYQATSADFAQTDVDNIFTGTQTFDKTSSNEATVGYCATATGQYAASIGGYYNDAKGGGSAVAGGNNSDTSGSFSFIGGGDTNCIEVCGVRGAIVGGDINVLKHPDAVMAGTTCIISVSSNMLHVEQLFASGLPTSNPGVPGVIWSNSGTLSVA